MSSTRRDFLLISVKIGAVPLLPAFLSGCGSDEISTPSDASSVCSGLSSAIGANHGHTFTVALADVIRGREKSISLTSNGTHSHVVTLSPADMDTIRTGGSVTVNSSSSASHTHPVTVSCVVTDSGASGDGGGSDASGDSSVSCSTVNDSVSTVMSHSHSLVVAVSQADVVAGADKVYSLTDVGHTHSFTITSAQFTMLAQGSTVMADSTLAGSGPHQHVITLSCV